jgi:hypothetical protein
MTSYQKYVSECDCFETVDKRARPNRVHLKMRCPVSNPLFQPEHALDEASMISASRTTLISPSLLLVYAVES